MLYRKKHIKSKISRIKPKRSVFGRLWFWLTLLSLAIIFTGFYLIFFYSGFQVKNILISGNSMTATQDLKNLVSDSANTGLVSFGNVKVFSRSIFLVNDQKIGIDILDKFPAIESVSVNKKIPNTLRLGVVERNPLGVFCPSPNLAKPNDGGCYLIDSNGIIFEPLKVIPANATIVRQIVKDSQVFPGKDVVARSTMSAIYKIQKNLKDNFTIDLKEALITSPVRLDVKTSENWKIYFDLDTGSNIDSQLMRLGLLLNGGISPETRKNLRYVDLRPKDRAIICDNKVCGG